MCEGRENGEHGVCCGAVVRNYSVMKCCGCLGLINLRHIFYDAWHVWPCHSISSCSLGNRLCVQNLTLASPQLIPKINEKWRERPGEGGEKETSNYKWRFTKQLNLALNFCICKNWFIYMVVLAIQFNLKRKLI